MLLAVVRDKGEDFRRDPVDGRQGIFEGPDDAEDFQCVLFESVHLKWHILVPVRVPNVQFRFTSIWSMVMAILRKQCFR